MKVFVVARDAGTVDLDGLVARLSAIQTEDAPRSSIIAVDNFYNLVAQPDTELGARRGFLLDDFLHEKGSFADGKVVLDTNRIAEQIGSIEQDWLVFDFGQHALSTGEDFIGKLATCLFMLPPARQSKLVFIVPRVQLPLYLRASNAALNVLPEIRSLSGSSLETDLLFLSATTEKLVARIPLLKWPFVMLRALARFAIRRVSNRARA
ncbi:hypothetical protein N5C93_06455 [Pseudomonas nitroreducens]|uniref:hypothetical protein n=1 Tax=Pseudomonas TaxID=286 RepID=UPI00080686D4|nr:MULTISPECIES: hypothetical protein [Pseudomonas]MDH1072472.1 hypothetical protein [Pseudomonas nitroreducens]NMZ72053.1 hypothetical protein [Pseudomonas nitroreducens]OBY57768.1 hypothetical protein A9513_005970 [Pseudomonas sp. AU12215]